MNTEIRSPGGAAPSGLVHPWPAPPEGGTTTLVAPGIRWIRMPLPFALNHINLWLLDDDRGVTAVDTGAGLPPTRELWEALFAGALADRPIVRVLVTHFHPGPHGQCRLARPALRSRAVVPAGRVADGAARLAGHGAAATRTSASDTTAASASPRDRSRPSGSAATSIAASSPRSPPSSTPCARATSSPSAARTWRAFTVLGHAPEHACLFSAADNILISGDQVLPKITTNVSVWPDQPRSNPLRLYLDSLARFRPLPEETLVLPSHGLPFRGLHPRLDHLRHHHEERLGEALDAIAEPRTVSDLLPVLFRRQLDTHQLGFAIGEALAHLHYLEAEGQASRLVGERRRPPLPEGLTGARGAACEVRGSGQAGGAEVVGESVTG